MGYREGREWWEGVIAIRKISIVAIGTFGTLMGVVDLQAFIALGKEYNFHLIRVIIFFFYQISYILIIQFPLYYLYFFFNRNCIRIHYLTFSW
jgi:hypothetical protein